MLYQIKKTLLWPRTVYRRRKAGLTGMGKAMLELHYYRSPMAEFAGVMSIVPDLLSNFELSEGSVIVDVGAFDGVWVTNMADRYKAEAHGYEPFPQKVAAFAESVADRGDVHAHAEGLGGETFSATLALTGEGSSIYKDSGHQGEAEIQIVAADEAFQSAGIDHIDLIKINIEGGEYDLLDHLLDTGWAGRIDHFLIQFHEWHPWAYWRRHRIRRRLRQTHEVVWDYNFVFEYWQRRRES